MRAIIWYWLEGDEGRLSGDLSKFWVGGDRFPTQADFERNWRMAYIESVGIPKQVMATLQHFYKRFNGEDTMPNPLAERIIGTNRQRPLPNGLRHTSISVGDIVQLDADFYMVNMMGFEKLPLKFPAGYIYPPEGWVGRPEDMPQPKPPSSPLAPDAEFWGKPISTYTVDQAVDDGVLADVRVDNPDGFRRALIALARGGGKTKLGRLIITAGVSDTAGDVDFAKFVVSSFKRYLKGDWGELAAEDRQSNDAAVASNNDRVFAAYEGQRKIWIITEWDRSVTTILFPEEY